SGWIRPNTQRREWSGRQREHRPSKEVVCRCVSSCSMLCPATRARAIESGQRANAACPGSAFACEWSRGLSELFGVFIAIVSSALRGPAAAITRYLVGSADPITLAILRWGIGILCVLPAALFLRVRWPERGDWLPVAALGLCFFGFFFVLYNIAVSYTTAARASLALSTLPLQTMVVGALLGIEPLTGRKSLGVCIAILGVVAALASALSASPSR